MASAVESIRNKIHLNEFSVQHASASDYPGNYPGYNDAWNFKKFKENFKIEVIKLNETEMEFDMIGIDASIANAFRRILIANVPTMAIEKVFIMNNTSIVQDEVLAHRLGLIPIVADPRNFKFPPDEYEHKTDEQLLEADPNIHIVFELKIKCKKNPEATENEENPDNLYIDSKVLTKHMKWIPIGNQLEKFGEKGIKPVFDDILIAKLRPGQEIDLRMHCVKGIGSDHAKFSPVATASYRLLPSITLLKPIIGELADRLVKCFSKGVIKIKESKGVRKAVVVNPRKDTGAREVFRDEVLKDLVVLEKIRNHFIFSIESTGALPPNVLVEEAIKILLSKCRHYEKQMEKV